jgi:outer membrane protein OmpA-like peptidoglycan-associated protein
VTAVTTKGFGPERPVDPADTPEAYAKNRRIEFTVSAAS